MRTPRGDYSPLSAALERFTIPGLWHLLNLPGKPAKSCRSPFRADRNASLSVYDEGRKWKDHASGQGGDVCDFLAAALNVSNAVAARRLIELAGALPATAQRKVTPKACDVADRRAKRATWPVFEQGTKAEWRALAALRGLSVEAVRLASERGLLWFTDSREGRAWIVSDSRRINAQARRMNGKPWERVKAKAWTLPGSEAAWPVGLRESESFLSIAVVEGGPDLLAAFHHAWASDCERDVAPVAMLGASNGIHPEALPLFAGKRVRLFPHADEAGERAARRWARTLANAGAAVDAFIPSGLNQSDGKPVKDLNDLALVSADDWERNREMIQGALNFKQEVN